ncbi:MAG: aldehyde ferredoxin oxidoreductase family protein [Chloroflexota bacterium]
MQPVLKINLTSGEWERLDIRKDWAEGYLGGSALAARMLYEHISPDIDPLSPSSSLLFLPGPLTGSAGPAVGRFVVCGRSPATYLWSESNCGGFWGPELRKAGFDGLWVTGKANVPVYLWIHDGQVAIREAGQVWGLDTYAIQEALQNELVDKRIRVLGIGPGGEAQLPMAVILCDHGRVAGRSGLGAVMGSKNLKAVAVQGNGKIPLKHPETFARLRTQANRDLHDDNFTQALRSLGNAGGADYFDYLGEMPKKYFQVGIFEGSWKVSGSSVAEGILAGVSACHGCVIACGRVVKLQDGVKRKGPEYETLVGFGPNLLIDDPVAITRFGEQCDRYGIDTISTSNTIGLAFTLFEQGFITEKDTDGLALKWGDVEVVETLLNQLIKKEGFGARLAQGALPFSRQYGAEELALQVNGLELPYHDPRGSSGMALSYATSPRGGCHNQSDYFLVDIGQVESSLGLKLMSRQAGAEKAANVIRHQDWRTLCNALVLCYFANISPQMVVELINAAVGLDWDVEAMLQAGERAWNLKRVINNKIGLRSQNDTLPGPLLQPLPDGGAAGYTIPLADMLQAYYASRGWDAQTGFPTPEKLATLGLEWTIPDIWGK